DFAGSLVAGREDFQPGVGTETGLKVSLSWRTNQDRETFRPCSQPLMAGFVGATRLDPTDSDAPVSGSPWQNDPIGWFCAAYGPFRHLVGDSTEAQRLMSTPGPAARLASLFYEDASLTEGVQWLIDKHLRSLEGKEWAGQLGRAAIQILADGLLPDDYEFRGRLRRPMGNYPWAPLPAAGNERRVPKRRGPRRRPHQADSRLLWRSAFR